MPRFVITGSQMRALEEEAFRKGADALLLMERAAEGVVQNILEMAPEGRVLFVCGKGNNGADGLAAARILLREGGKPAVLLTGEMKTPEGQRNLRFARYAGVPEIRDFPERPGEDGFGLIVDALWGTGFRGAPAGGAAGLIRQINASGLPVLSVDMPSGMNADDGSVPGDCVRADRTVTFHAPKLGLYTGPRSDLAGLRITWDIGLLPPAEGIPACREEDLPSLLPPRKSNAHKASCGRVLILAGSPGKAGAAAMCALAALRSGAGLVTVACPESVIPVLQVLVPNAMCVPAEEALLSPPPFDVLAAGCGIGVGPAPLRVLRGLLSGAKKAVLDADALTLLSQTPFPLPDICVLTPHVGEGARLLHRDSGAVLDSFTDSCAEIASRYRCTVLLKSAASAVSDGTRLALNLEGSPALAKGGSGDALCGIVAAQLCSAADPFEAARIAALRLGVAGKRGEKRFGTASLLTGEMLTLLP